MAIPEKIKAATKKMGAARSCALQEYAERSADADPALHRRLTEGLRKRKKDLSRPLNEIPGASRGLGKSRLKTMIESRRSKLAARVAKAHWKRTRRFDPN